MSGFPLPVPDPPPEPTPPRTPNQPPRRMYGPTRASVTRKRESIKAQILGADFGGLSVAEPAPHIPMPSEVPVLRTFARRALFSPEDQPDRISTVVRKDLHGYTHLFAQQLSWVDLRTLMLVIHIYRLSGGTRYPTVLISPSTLARLIRGKKATAEAVELTERSLRRLRQARFCLTDKHGTPQVGTPDDPVGFLESEDLPSAKTGRLRLSPWLHEHVAKGINEPSSGLMEYRISWPLVRVLRGRSLLLYLWLECERLQSGPLHPHPFNPALPPLYRKTRPICPELLAMLGLEHHKPFRWRSELRRCLRTIWARDSRYEFAEIGRSGEWIEIWKKPGKIYDDLIWTGKICRNCQRPNPEGPCCCGTNPGCTNEHCPACQELAASHTAHQ